LLPWLEEYPTAHRSLIVLCLGRRGYCLALSLSHESGFLVFLLSVHQGLSNFGVLAAIAMFSALLADILLLPAMIYVFKPFDKEIAEIEAAK